MKKVIRHQFGVKLIVLAFIVSRFIGIHCFSQVGINTTGTAPANSAMLDVSSTTQGQLFPRMTTVQRTAIVSPVESLIIYNTDTHCFEAYYNGGWVGFGCIGCQVPSAPTAGTHTPGQTTITWNWNIVSEATGYKWNTTNNYATATDNLTSASYNQTNLT